MRKLLINIGICVVLATSGCSIHRVDVQQGNVIEKEELDKLKKGMSKKQVKFLLGTPLLQDAFHTNQWVYIYTYKKGQETASEKKRLILHFKNNILKTIDNKGYPNPA